MNSQEFTLPARLKYGWTNFLKSHNTPLFQLKLGIGGWFMLADVCIWGHEIKFNLCRIGYGVSLIALLWEKSFANDKWRFDKEWSSILFLAWKRVFK